MSLCIDIYYSFCILICKLRSQITKSAGDSNESVERVINNACL